MFCPRCGTKNNQESRFCTGCGAVQVLVAEPAIEQEPVSLLQPPRFAGVWVRTLAAIIDVVLLVIVLLVLIVFFGVVLGLSAYFAGTSTKDDMQAASFLAGILIAIVVPWLWFTISEGSNWQATVGKKLLGLKINVENGERVGFGRANVRFWSKYFLLAFFFISWVMIALTGKKQGLHDLIARTIVVKASA